MDLEHRTGLAGFSIVEVRDPAELDEQSRVSRRLAGRNVWRREGHNLTMLLQSGVDRAGAH